MIQVTGIEQEAFEACLLVGFHSRAGTVGGLLAHTWVGALVHEIRLAGRPAGEILLDAAIVGHYGVPVVLVTGGDDAEAATWLPIADLSPAMLFEDHAAIITALTGIPVAAPECKELAA